MPQAAASRRRQRVGQFSHPGNGPDAGPRRLLPAELEEALRNLPAATDRLMLLLQQHEQQQTLDAEPQPHPRANSSGSGSGSGSASTRAHLIDDLQRCLGLILDFASPEAVTPARAAAAAGAIIQNDAVCSALLTLFAVGFDPPAPSSFSTACMSSSSSLSDSALRVLSFGINSAASTAASTTAPTARLALALIRMGALQHWSRKLSAATVAARVTMLRAPTSPGQQDHHDETLAHRLELRAAALGSAAAVATAGPRLSAASADEGAAAAPSGTCEPLQDGAVATSLVAQLDGVLQALRTPCKLTMYDCEGSLPPSYKDELMAGLAESGVFDHAAQALLTSMELLAPLRGVREGEEPTTAAAGQWAGHPQANVWWLLVLCLSIMQNLSAGLPMASSATALRLRQALSAPGVQYLFLAAAVTVLCAADGETSYGMPARLLCGMQQAIKEVYPGQERSSPAGGVGFSPQLSSQHQQQGQGQADVADTPVLVVSGAGCRALSALLVAVAVPNVGPPFVSQQAVLALALRIGRLAVASLRVWNRQEEQQREAGAAVPARSGRGSAVRMSGKGDAVSTCPAAGPPVVPPDNQRGGRSDGGVTGEHPEVGPPPRMVLPRMVLPRGEVARMAMQSLQAVHAVLYENDSASIVTTGGGGRWHADALVDRWRLTVSFLGQMAWWPEDKDVERFAKLLFPKLTPDETDGTRGQHGGGHGGGGGGGGSEMRDDPSAAADGGGDVAAAGLPPDILAALAGGLLPALERLLRRACRNLSGPELHFLWFLLDDTSYPLPYLLAYGSDQEVASFAATLRKARLLGDSCRTGFQSSTAAGCGFPQTVSERAIVFALVSKVDTTLTNGHAMLYERILTDDLIGLDRSRCAYPPGATGAAHMRLAALLRAAVQSALPIMEGQLTQCFEKLRNPAAAPQIRIDKGLIGRFWMMLGTLADWAALLSVPLSSSRPPEGSPSGASSPTHGGDTTENGGDTTENGGDTTENGGSGSGSAGGGSDVSTGMDFPAVGEDPGNRGDQGDPGSWRSQLLRRSKMLSVLGIGLRALQGDGLWLMLREGGNGPLDPLGWRLHLAWALILVACVMPQDIMAAAAAGASVPVTGALGGSAGGSAGVGGAAATGPTTTSMCRRTGTHRRPCTHSNAGVGAAVAAAPPAQPLSYWPPDLIQSLAADLRAGNEALARTLEALASRLGGWGGGFTADEDVRRDLDVWLTLPHSLMMAARNLASPVDLSSALRTCSNPTCTNLEGDTEAELRLQVCSRCRTVSYCSRDCQIAHWRAGHKVECVVVARAVGTAAAEASVAAEGVAAAGEVVTAGAVVRSCS